MKDCHKDVLHLKRSVI